MHKLIFGKEKSVLSYNSYGLEYSVGDDVNLWMEVCKPSTSSWWSTLPKSIGTHNISAIFKDMFKNRQKLTSVRNNKVTMKNCPGIMGLFKSTILLKAPMDMTIHLKDIEQQSDNQVIVECVLPQVLKIESHPAWQFSNSGSTWSNYRNVKFGFPFIISSTHPFIFAQPYWHNSVPFDVPPGGLFGQYYKHELLNLNTFFKVDGKQEYNTFTIKKGTVLGYMIFPYPVSLNYNPKLSYDARISMLKNGSLR